MDYKLIREKLEKAGVAFDDGLSLNEFKAIESKFKISFPSDFKDFLSHGLPIGKGWVNWRIENEKEILGRLESPYKGICFDIEHNNYWQKSWGVKPDSLDGCFKKAKILVNDAPKLIPIYFHRYIPDEPNDNGNPILSVHQTDIIYYGVNLEDYFENEFFKKCSNLKRPYSEFKKIEFWSDIVENY